MEGEFRRGQRSIDEFLKLVAVTNPTRASSTYVDPDGNKDGLRAGSPRRCPQETEEIKPHPHGVELGTMLIRMLQDCHPSAG